MNLGAESERAARWRGTTVLVTGAGGFIGSALTNRLASLGARTRAFVRYNSAGSWGWLDRLPIKHEIDVRAGDIRDPDTLKAACQDVDTVFHLAALIAIPYSYTSPLSYIRTNVEGTLNVLQAAHDAGVRLVVHTSTSEVYGSARYVPIDEEHPLRGQSPYSASKIAADKVAESFHLSFGRPIVTVRPFNTFGPRQSARAVIPSIITQALTESVLRLGSLTPTRDFNYVEDTVDGFIRAAEVPAAIGEVINLGSGIETSVADVARLVLELIGKQIPIVSEPERVRPEASEVVRLCASADKAARLLGWTPQYGLRGGLAETIRWVEQNLEHYRTGIYAT